MAPMFAGMTGTSLSPPSTLGAVAILEATRTLPWENGAASFTPDRRHLPLTTGTSLGDVPSSRG